MSRRNSPVVLEARRALDTFKLEIAAELDGSMGDAMYEFGGELGMLSSGHQSFAEASKTGYYGNVTSRECGVVGGHMTRRMVENSESGL